jgi:sulfite reductase beta subunit-like hemoprotein
MVGAVMCKPENPPAFPHQWCNEHHVWHFEDGMTLRDWFAGQALLRVYNDGGRYSPEGMKQVAKYSYAMADAMLAERERQS